MGNATGRFVAAAVQAAPVFLDLEATLAKTERLIGEAAGLGARLIVFPEAFFSGYPIWLWGDRAGSIPNLEQTGFVRLWQQAIDIPGPVTERIGTAAREHAAVVVIGVNEREDRYGRTTLYNSVLTFDTDGTLRGRHRKLVPTYRERTVYGQGDASGLAVRETGAGRIGSLVCWENYMPLARFGLYAGGEQIHTAVTVDASPSWERLMQTVAAEGRVFVVAAAQFFRRESLPEEPLLSNFALEADVLIDGGSMIVDPGGNLLAGPLRGQEGIVTAEIDLDRIIAEKHSLDVTGHYARPDLFKLAIDRTPAGPVTFKD